MTLNIGGSGSSRPHAKFSSKSGRWHVRNEEREGEIQPPTFVCDLANIATGWICFREGKGPERVMDPSLTQAAPSPGGEFRRGFVVNCYSKQFFGGLVEFSANGLLVANAVRDLYLQFEEQRGSNPGKVPVVQCAAIEPQKGRHGTNYAPRFAIVKWVDRPADVPDASPIDSAEVWKPDPSSGSKRVSAPVQPPAPAQSAAATSSPETGTQRPDPMMVTEF